jgi:glycine betaine/choline ABC-type transport system substrate-binding protein
VANGDADVGVAASTDGRIPALDLVLLEDDMGFFPPYYAAPIVRQDLLEEAPEVRDILNQMAGQITNEQMQSMNYNVDEDGQEPVDVARQFLTDAGLIEG